MYFSKCCTFCSGFAIFTIISAAVKNSQKVSRCVPGFDGLWWQDSRNQVLQRRDEEALVDLTVRVVFCLDTKAQTSTYICDQIKQLLHTIEHKEYLIYVNWIVLRHQKPALLSISNDLTKFKNSEKQKHGRTYEFNISTDPSVSSLISQQQYLN